MLEPSGDVPVLLVWGIRRGCSQWPASGSDGPRDAVALDFLGAREGDFSEVGFVLLGSEEAAPPVTGWERGGRTLSAVFR